MSDSILDSIKKVLGIDAAYTAFDQDILMHINSVISTLSQIGIGLDTGFAVEDSSAVWSDFLGTDPDLNSVKTYIYLRVRMLFDPPSTSYLVSAMQDQIRELEWRINTKREATAWVDPDPDPIVTDEDPTSTMTV